MPTVSEEQLWFVQIREMSPQWNVYVGPPGLPEGKDWEPPMPLLPVARVTERLIAKPRYAVVLIGEDGEDMSGGVGTDVANQDAVLVLVANHAARRGY